MKTFNEFLTEEWGNLKPIPESILKKIRASHHLSRDSEVRKITDVEAKRLIATRGDMPFVIVDYNTPDSFVVHDYYGHKNYPIQVKIYDGNEIDFDPRSVPKWNPNIFYIAWTRTHDDVNNSRKIAKRSTANSRAKNIKLLADDLFQSLLLKIGPEYRASMKAKHKLLGDIYYMCPPVPVGEKSTEADNDLFRHMARNKIDYPLITKLKDYYKALESDLRKKGWLNEDTVYFGEFLAENWGNLKDIPKDILTVLMQRHEVSRDGEVKKITKDEAIKYLSNLGDDPFVIVSWDHPESVTVIDHFGYSRDVPTLTGYEYGKVHVSGKLPSAYKRSPWWSSNIYRITWTGTDPKKRKDRKYANAKRYRGESLNIKVLAQDLYDTSRAKIDDYFYSREYLLSSIKPLGADLLVLKLHDADDYYELFDMVTSLHRWYDLHGSYNVEFVKTLKEYYRRLMIAVKKAGGLNESAVSSFVEYINESWGNLNVIPDDFRAAMKHLSRIKLGPESRVEKLTTKQARGFFTGELDGEVTFVSFDDNGEGYLCNVDSYRSFVYRVKGGNWKDTDLDKPKFLKHLYRIYQDSNALYKMKNRGLVRADYMERTPMINPNNVKYLSIELADAFTKDVYKKWRKKEVDLKRFISPNGVEIAYFMDYTDLPAFNKVARELNLPTNALAQSLIRYYKEIRDKLGI